MVKGKVYIYSSQHGSCRVLLRVGDKWVCEVCRTSYTSTAEAVDYYCPGRPKLVLIKGGVA